MTKKGIIRALLFEKRNKETTKKNKGIRSCRDFLLKQNKWLTKWRKNQR